MTTDIDPYLRRLRALHQWRRRKMNLTPPVLKEKIDEIQRELRVRRKVFPRLIKAGELTREEADRRDRIFESILDDYRVAVANGRQESFDL